MMKLISTVKVVTGSTHHASLRRCGAAIGALPAVVGTELMRPPCGGPRNGPPRPPALGARRETRRAPRSRVGSCVLLGELLLPVLVEITAVGVVQHDGREALDLEPPDCFR